MKQYQTLLACFILLTAILINVIVSQLTITAADLRQIRRALAIGTNNNTILDASEFIDRVLRRTTRTTTVSPNDNTTEDAADEDGEEEEDA